MSDPASTLLRWSPRLLGVLVALFIGAFALDATDEGLPALLLHAAPALALLLAVALAWRREWVGGIVFVALGVFYGATMTRRWDWILAISGPLIAVGLLFFWSWARRRAARG